MERVLDIAGAFFFRVRSFAPLPVIWAGLWLCWDSHLTPGPFDATLDLVGLGLCTLGALVRFVTIGFVPAGTSSQSRTLQNHALNTEGPYALVRHPLYLGNLLITSGLLCIVNERWAWALGLGYWLLSHLFIVRAEEALLRRTWGYRYDEWAARVPAWVPRPRRVPFPRAFAFKRAVQREVNPLVAWGLGATLLLLWERFARTELPAALGRRYLTVAAALLVLLIANKVWKKVSRA